MNQFENLLELGNKFSITALKNFYAKVGLNPQDFEDIYAIECTIGITKTGNNDDICGYAQYEPTNNKIIVSPEYLHERLLDINNADVKDIAHIEQLVILNIAETLIHERIHACRTIPIPKDSINALYLLPEYRDDLIMKNIQHYNNMAYDIPTDKDTTKYLVACDFDHQSDGWLINKNDKIANEDLFWTLEQKCEEEALKLDKQDSLEEAITEALANMILYNSLSKFSHYSITELAERTIKKTDNNFVRAGANIIRSMGPNMISWFLNTRNMSQYHDLFALTFKDKYDDLLNAVYKLDETKLSSELDSHKNM